MKNLKITKREIVFFFIGVFAMVLIDVVFDWSDAKKSFMDGFNGAASKVEQTR